MWGVLRKASNSPVVCGSAGGCWMSCLFDKDVVLLSLLLGCRVRLVYPAEALPGLLSRSVIGPLQSGEASLCVVVSGAGTCNCGLHHFACEATRQCAYVWVDSIESGQHRRGRRPAASQPVVVPPLAYGVGGFARETFNRFGKRGHPIPWGGCRAAGSRFLPFVLGACSLCHR